MRALFTDFLAVSAGTAVGFGILQCWIKYKYEHIRFADQRERSFFISDHGDHTIKKLNLSSSLGDGPNHEDGSSN
jgi:hypothetical protein